MIPNGTTKTDKYDSHSFGTSSFVEKSESEADMNKGPRKDEPGVEQEFSIRGQQFSKGSGQWTASDGYFSGEYPDGKQQSSYSTCEERGKIKWNDFSKSTERLTITAARSLQLPSLPKILTQISLVTLGNYRKTINDVTKERQQHKDGTETKSDENITRYDTSISATVNLEVTRNVTDTSTPGVTIINNTSSKTHRQGKTGSISSSSENKSTVMGEFAFLMMRARRAQLR